MLYWISNAGGGNGLSAGSRFQVADFIALPPAPGDIGIMGDGVYTGANSMINPTTGLGGSSGNPIVILAENDGAVRINGEGARTPVWLNNNDWFDIEGINCHDSNGPVYYVANGSNNVQLRRCCGWDAASGNFHVFSFDTSSNGLIEDCAAWGRGRKMMEFYNGTNNTGRRCWARHSREDGTGGVTFEMSYTSTGTTWENCIGSWAREGGGPNVGGHGGIFSWSGSSSGNDDSKLLGSIAYIRGSDQVSIDTGLVMSGSGPNYQNPDGIDVVAYVQPGYHTSIRPFSMNNAQNNSLAGITAIGGTTDAFANWSVSNYVKSATSVSIWTGTGATIGYRYENRVLTSTPLWPWPMDQRIKDALVTSGYQSVTFGFNNNTGYLTDAIEEMFGTIPPEYYSASPSEDPGESPPESSPPEETSPPESSPTDEVLIPSAGRTPLFLLDIELDSGIERVSGREVNSPTLTYEPFVVSYGVFESGIPSPVGLPITGDAKFKLAESQTRKWRDLFAHQTPRRRVVKLWALFEGESLSERTPGEPRVPFFTGEIVDAVFNSDRSIEITCRDRTFAWLDEPIPAMITKDIYPGLLERYEGQFLPIVCGEVRTVPQVVQPGGVPQNALGQIALPRMGWDQEIGDRWGVAAHPCARIVVYRKMEIAIDGEQTEEWELVSPGEYEEFIIPVTAFNIEMNHHIIGFFLEQPDGTELRADIDGIRYRGPWGGLAEEGTPLGSPPQGTEDPAVPALRSPIDFFANMTFFIMKKAGVEEDPSEAFDVDDISLIRDKFDAQQIVCDGAITKPITCREWLGEFLPSFNLDMWQKRNGKISLNYTDEENFGRIVYTETDLILKNTFSERMPEKPINQYQYRYLYNHAEDTWGTWGLLNTAEQSVLALGLMPKVEKEVLDLHWVRHPVTAVAVTTHRAQFQSLGSYSQEWQLPLPEVPVSLEPSSLIGVTHRMGLETGGYVDREVKVLKLRHDLDKLVTTVTGILRVPQTVTQVGSPP